MGEEKGRLFLEIRKRVEHEEKNATQQRNEIKGSIRVVLTGISVLVHMAACQLLIESSF